MGRAEDAVTPSYTEQAPCRGQDRTLKRYNYPRAAALDDKARRLLQLHRSQISFKDEVADERHRRAIRRIKRLMNPHWEAEQNHRIGMRLLSRYA